MIGYLRKKLIPTGVPVLIMYVPTYSVQQIPSFEDGWYRGTIKIFYTLSVFGLAKFIERVNFGVNSAYRKTLYLFE